MELLSDAQVRRAHVASKFHCVIPTRSFSCHVVGSCVRSLTVGGWAHRARTTPASRTFTSTSRAALLPADAGASRAGDAAVGSTGSARGAESLPWRRRDTFPIRGWPLAPKPARVAAPELAGRTSQRHLSRGEFVSGHSAEVFLGESSGPHAGSKALMLLCVILALSSRLACE